MRFCYEHLVLVFITILFILFFYSLYYDTDYVSIQLDMYIKLN